MYKNVPGMRSLYFSMKTERKVLSPPGVVGGWQQEELSLARESLQQRDLCSASLGEKPRASTWALLPGDNGRLGRWLLDKFE